MSFKFIASHRSRPQITGGSNAGSSSRNIPNAASVSRNTLSAAAINRNRSAAPDIRNIEVARWIFEQRRNQERGQLADPNTGDNNNHHNTNNRNESPVIVISDDEDDGGGGHGNHHHHHHHRQPIPSLHSIRTTGTAVKRKIHTLDDDNNDDNSTIIVRRPLPPGVFNRGSRQREGRSEIIDLTSDDPPSPIRRPPKRQRNNRYQDRNEPDVGEEEEDNDELRLEIHGLLGETPVPPRPPSRVVVVVPPAALPPAIPPPPPPIIPSPTPTPTPPPPKPKPNLLHALPLEILNKIYRLLLVSPNPIPVKDLWQEVIRAPPRRTTRARAPAAAPLRRRSGRVPAMGEEPSPDFSIDPAILQVCKHSFVLGSRILYGENVFSYLLRDPSAARAHQSQHQNQHQQQQISRGHGRGGGSKNEGGKNRIDWARYGGLIRRVEIEMERNRTGGEYAALMGCALERLGGGGGGRRGEIRLRELVVRVSPLYDEGDVGEGGQGGGGQGGGGRYLSVVQLFGRNGRVMRALRGVEVDFLRVCVNVNSHLMDGEGEEEQDDDDDEGEEGGEVDEEGNEVVKARKWSLEMRLDLRWLGRCMERLRREGPVGEGWVNDRLIKEAREERGRRAEEDLGRLRKLIEEACEMPEYVVKQGRRGGLWMTAEEAEVGRVEERKRLERKFDVDGYDDLDPTRQDVIELRRKVREEQEESEGDSDEDSDDDDDSDGEDDDDANDTNSEEGSDNDDDSADDDEEERVEIKDIPLSRRLRSLVISIDKVGDEWKCFRI
ncbi:hypothetical protein QBC41DRAFT_379245 [Cercophora samala]|uniref:Uncharacterized protein n=1 Tax=Cercophora samala TaxID=330535 RepID=A0AA39Z7C3_9PEZI|nr:hypothetical protein QBC41DRAFT_379245 [Cercophora samala]